MAGLIYPWRAGNQFQLLIDGPAFLPIGWPMWSVLNGK